MDNEKLNYLLSSLKVGDYTALDGIYTMCSTRLYHIALAILHDKHLAEDSLQESMVALYKGARGYRDNTNAYGYIARIVQNTSLNILKRERRKGSSYISVEEINWDTTTESPYANIEAIDTVSRLLARLSSEDRQLLILKYYSEMTIREIAAVVGRPKSTVERKINAAELILINIAKEENYNG